jgi:2-polyprenyl-3-methyl-5-hydroxy-6-metoxy-1,4-benzoquinol methylase
MQRRGASRPRRLAKCFRALHEAHHVDARMHWEQVYRTKRPTEVSWYAPHLETSLRLIEEASPDRDAAIIDVGGGESTLADDLLDRGYRHLSVLDLSATAFEVAKARLGERSGAVEWLCGDVRTFPLRSRHYDVWHDRAVFHFLTNPADRAAYVRQVMHAVKPGGCVIVATFGPEGPSRCSGLDVARYGADALHDEFGPRFRLLNHLTEIHQTPAGTTQQFTYCYCKVRSRKETQAVRR